MRSVQPQDAMRPLQVYLQTHFVSRQRFAELADVSQQRLERLLQTGAIPDATYRLDGESIQSRAFGRIAIDVSLTGDYFRPECVRWAVIADGAPPGDERAQVLDVLCGELRAALEGHGFSADDIARKMTGYLPAFFDGTFGLCVADPSTGHGIVEKEVLQERLSALTQNGSNPHPAGIGQAELLQLIDAYAAAAMPFSPAEYARSSRKRLVDDLRPALAGAFRPVATH